MHARILWVVAGLFTSSLLAADEAFTSGLKHTLITNAVFSTDLDDPLTVINTGYPEEGGSNIVYGLFGASVHLGAADGGVSVSVSCSAMDGWAMDGTSYGTVGGATNSLIGTVSGTRNGYGRYETHVDFSPIGATSYIYQLYFHDLKTLEVTNGGPDSVVDVGNSGANSPHINPIWLNGSRVGVTIEFDYSITDFYVPGFHAYASRMIILAENPTNTVEQVSRVDIFGRGGLDYFRIHEERLGKFGLYHQTIGDVRLHATPSQLTVSNLDASALQGILTELPHVQTFEASLLPRELTNETFAFLASVSGSSSLTPDLKFLGDVMLRRESNEVSLSILPGGSGPGVASVFDNGTLVGSIMTTNEEFGTETEFPTSGAVMGIIHATNLVLTSYGAVATRTNDSAYIGLRFAHTITLSNAAGTTLTGDEIRFSTTSSDEIVTALTAFAFTAQSVDHITITNIETFALPSEPMRLSFGRSGENLLLSWLYNPDFYLASKFDVTGDWQGASNGTFTHTNTQAYFETPLGYWPEQYYELKHNYGSYLFTPLDPGGSN